MKPKLCCFIYKTPHGLEFKVLSLRFISDLHNLFQSSDILVARTGTTLTRAYSYSFLIFVNMSAALSFLLSLVLMILQRSVTTSCKRALTSSHTPKHFCPLGFDYPDIIMRRLSLPRLVVPSIHHGLPILLNRVDPLLQIGLQLVALLL